MNRPQPTPAQMEAALQRGIDKVKKITKPEIGLLVAVEIAAAYGRFLGAATRHGDPQILQALNSAFARGYESTGMTVPGVPWGEEPEGPVEPVRP